MPGRHDVADLEPAPDLLSGEWKGHGGYFMVVGPRGYRIQDGYGKLLEEGTWKKLDTKVYIRTQRPGAPIYVPRTYHTESELEQNPVLRISSPAVTIELMEKVVPYRLEGSGALAVLHAGYGKQAVIANGYHFERPYHPPRPWWEAPWERIQACFRK